MLFPTVEYFIFFIIVFFLSWYIFNTNKEKKVFLLIASYVFYGFWDWAFVPLLIGISVVSYFFAVLIQQNNYPHYRKKFLVTGIIICLSILFYYKYVGFFLLNLVNFVGLFGGNLQLNFESPVLPLGVSFFVFHAISLLGDAYRNKIPVRITALDSLLYIAFFPQLIAGPILRAASFLPQLSVKPKEDKVRANIAWMLIVVGLVKKLIISNYLATKLVDDVFATPSAYSGIDILFATYGYAAQIYCDFSGYTCIAAGCALLLGYKFPRNFNAPYFASNPQEFWHRWHISLSTWLRDYLYIPLGGSRNGIGRTYFNLFITMVVGGLWHGASWTFVIWGVLHGAILVMHRFWSLLNVTWVQRLRQAKWWAWVSRLLLFHVICVGWVFFRATSFDNAFEMFKGLMNWGSSQLLTPSILLLIFLGIFAQYRPRSWDRYIELEIGRWPMVVVGIVLAIAIYLIDILSPTGIAPFIYFQF